MVVDIANKFLQKTKILSKEAHEILSKHEGARSRIILLDQTRRRLKILSLQQDELFQEALACVEGGIFRASHVIAWSGYMDFLEHKLSSDGMIKVKELKPGWNKYTTMDEIRENVPEFQIIEVARDIGLISKSEAKTLHGLLSKRNECAHPGGYNPNMNESLGYISELLNRIERMNPKSL